VLTAVMVTMLSVSKYFSKKAAAPAWEVFAD
jgi:hypothetical protein